MTIYLQISITEINDPNTIYYGNPNREVGDRERTNEDYHIFSRKKKEKWHLEPFPKSQQKVYEQDMLQSTRITGKVA